MVGVSGLAKAMRSVRTQLTLLMVALLVCCCAVLTLLVYRSTSALLELAATQSLQRGNLSIILDVDGIERAILSDTLSILALVVVVGSWAAYLLAGRYTRPIKQLSSRVRAIEPSTLSEPIEVDGGEEIKELVRSFNQMTCQLDEAFAMQRRFSASAAHELRTPLAVLRTRIDVFRKKERQQTEYDELVNTMETYVNRLSSLVGNLLELTDTGELPDVQRVSLDSVLAHVAADLGPLARESNVSLSCHAQPVSIMGNASLLYRAFYNLAENAIRYNFNGGKVELQLSASREGAVATVSDTGVGIAPDVRELVFEPFYRVNKSRSREFGGAGIGLSLVKTILARHGARVAVGENQPQGSVFTVTFGSGGEVLTERG